MSEHGASDITPHGHIAEWEALALDYLEGTLAAPERAQVDGHLAACPTCRAALQDQRAMAAELRAVPPAAPPQHLQAAVFAALGAAAAGEPAVDAGTAHEPARRHSPPPRTSPARWLRSLLQPRRLALAGTLLVFVVVGAVALSSQPRLVQRQSEGSAARTGPVTTTVAAVASAESSTTEGTPSVAGGNAGPTSTTTRVGSTTLAQSPATTAGAQVTTAVATTVDGQAVTTTTMALDVMAKYMGTPAPTWVAVSGEEGAEVTAAAFSSATGLEPLPPEYWMGGPTFAVVTATSQAAGLLSHLQKRGFRLGLDGRPLDTLGNALNGILAGYTTYPRLSWADETLAVDPTSGAISEEQAALLVFFVTE